jgi:hypothetical protein
MDWPTERVVMTYGEVLAIIQMLEKCKKAINPKSVKKVAAAIDIKVTAAEMERIDAIIKDTCREVD